MSDDYSFLQEKIKDEAGSPKMLRKKVTRMIVFGLIFGIIACFTFFALKPWVAGILGQDKEEVSIPEDEEEAVKEQSAEEAVSNAQEQAAEQQQMRLLKELQNKAKDVALTMVFISGQREIEKDTEIMTTSGVVVADNGSEILILSQTLSDKSLKNIRVTFYDGREYAAKVKMKDNNIGIVICAVEKELFSEESLKQINITKLGNSLDVEAGDPAILLSKPKADESYVSYGFVASSEEKQEIADGNIELLRVDVAGATFESGMLFNQNGDMIGLVNKNVSDNKSLVTVYSISDIKHEIERMSNGKSVAYMGIHGVTVPEELADEGFHEGIWVKEVDTDSPAMEAGIQPGDIITQISDREVKNMDEFRSTLLKSSEKETVLVTGFRKGADDSYVEMQFKVIIGKK